MFMTDEQLEQVMQHIIEIAQDGRGSYALRFLMIRTEADNVVQHLETERKIAKDSEG